MVKLQLMHDNNDLFTNMTHIQNMVRDMTGNKYPFMDVAKLGWTDTLSFSPRISDGRLVWALGPLIGVKIAINCSYHNKR